MRHGIIADGPQRFYSNEEYKIRRRELWNAVVAKYSRQIAEAGFFRRFFIGYLRHREFRKELRKMTPSPASCWSVVLGRDSTKSKGANHKELA